MANLGDISKINLPNGNVVNIKDATARAQANWNTNNGVKNLLPINNATGTTVIIIPIVLSSGTFTLSIDNLTSEVTGEGSRCCFMNGENAVSNIEHFPHTSNVSATFTITATSDSLWIYAAGGWNSSNGKSLSITNAMLAPKSLYDADSTYEPYALPNTKITPELIELVDSGAKNLIELDLATIKSLNNSSGYTWNNNAVTNKGVTYTINNDMSISLTGTASGLSYIRLKSNFTVPKGTLILSGCPSGGAANTYRLYTDGITNGWEDVGQSSEKTFASDVTATYLTIAVNSGTTTGFTFKPMVCTKAAWDVSQKFVPYGMNNTELTAKVPITKSKRHIPQSADYEIVSDLTISIPGGKKYLIHAMAMFSNVAPKGVIINKTNTIAANKNTVYAEITNDTNDFGGLTTSAIMSNTGSTAFDVCIFAKFKAANASGSDVIVTYQDITESV